MESSTLSIAPPAPQGAAVLGKALRLFRRRPTPPPRLQGAAPGGKRANLICVQWFVAIATSYLCLFREGSIVLEAGTLAFVSTVLASMLVFQHLPQWLFERALFYQGLVVVDTALISVAIALNKESPWDLLLMFFFAIFIAAIGENLLRIALTCLGLGIVSVWLFPLAGHEPLRLDAETLLRIPLLFGSSLVYGYMADQVKNEKRKAAELEQRRRQQLQLKDQFLSHVSHELRTPLSAIHQFVTILRDGLAGDLNEEQRDYLGIVYRNVKQLQGMISDLLEATRADTGKLAMEPRVASVGAAVRETLETLTTSAIAKGVHLSYELADDLPPVYADPQRLRQVLINLIENAIKFTPAGGRVAVRAGLEVGTGFVRVAVADTGCGIRAEAAERIFDRLYQEAQIVESRKGLGLGLFICKALVELHGGRIWVESEPGKGSVFSFTVPVYSLRSVLKSILVANGRPRDRVTLIKVETSVAPEGGTSDALQRELWGVLQQCVVVGKSSLLPRIEGTGDRPPFYLVHAGDGPGGQEPAQQIRQQLRRSSALKEAASELSVSPIPIEVGEESRISAERFLELVCERIESVIGAPGADRIQETRTDLVGAVSQRLRTPLSVVMGYAAILREKLLGELNPEQESALEKLMVNTYDLILTLNNLLEAQRIEAGAVRAERYPVDLNRLLQELGHEYDSASRRSIAIVWDCAKNLPAFEGDGRKLRMVLQNLIHNAIKFTEKGSVTVSAAVVPGVSEEEDRLRFSVADTGPGIPPDRLRTIFEPPPAAPGSDKSPPEALGLGLFIVKSFTELLGGSVTVASEPGKGSTFTVSVPLGRRIEA